ncbi:hypothetical protein B9G69_016040 [Bdellovibrio sp. SKB1291214]|uniref:hypothetical protein n=1 Tax=Bdellovibrio sp. SKB1291214 TaxID=1732569 RepID=UPI000B515798|nr:hypothetical protein [Bdellovibrio sp. SKB1291214]UYL08555.1 hypothetical protein B9G69_016040 [Bdellovibrio sp. SKB1291214]
MKNILVSFAVTAAASTLMAASAPDVAVCDSQQGKVEFTFAPLSASWVQADGTTTPFLKYGTICNQDVSEMNPKPNCRVKDESADHYWINTIECQSEGQFYAEGFVEISQISKDGRFQCKTKFGAQADIKLDLTNCHR